MLLLTPLEASAESAAPPRTAVPAGETVPAEPAEDPEPSSQEFQTLPEPAPAPGRSGCDEQHLKELRDAGQERAVCVEWGDPQEAPKRKAAQPGRAAKSAASTFWCSNQNMDKTYVTRTSICSRRSMTILLVDTMTGRVWGKARGYTEQEINTKNNSVEFDEHFKFHLTKSDLTSSLMTVKVESICSLDDSCKQSSGPWAEKPQPITVGQSVEGHWTRSWNGNKGRKTFLLQYDIIVNIASSFGDLSWGGHREPGGGTYKVRCDNSVTKYAGCVVPSFTPTLVVPKKHKEARLFIAVAQASMSTHPGLEGGGKPLHREGSEAQAKKNRDIVCDKTFKAASNTPKPSCDEYPFARSKESGRRLGVTSGKSCQWYWVAEDTVNGKKNRLLMWDGLFEAKLPPANAKCARASMPAGQNKGVGGELGKKTSEWRLLNNDAYWVDVGAKK
ncbi:hypothetical protein [Streptomyces sp. RK9]|uniref:NucA/NucB deoxyribonuclease domain-containing protein n=1 Tax=Streptomyces sp. RK9 TaxID=3239284 RepID=UPI0038687F0D